MECSPWHLLPSRLNFPYSVSLQEEGDEIVKDLRNRLRFHDTKICQVSLITKNIYNLKEFFFVFIFDSADADNQQLVIVVNVIISLLVDNLLLSFNRSRRW